MSKSEKILKPVHLELDNKQRQLQNLRPLKYEQQPCSLNLKRSDAFYQNTDTSTSRKLLSENFLKDIRPSSKMRQLKSLKLNYMSTGNQHSLQYYKEHHSPPDTHLPSPLQTLTFASSSPNTNTNINANANTAALLSQNMGKSPSQSVLNTISHPKHSLKHYARIQREKVLPSTNIRHPFHSSLATQSQPHNHFASSSKRQNVYAPPLSQRNFSVDEYSQRSSLQMQPLAMKAKASLGYGESQASLQKLSHNFNKGKEFNSILQSQKMLKSSSAFLNIEHQKNENSNMSQTQPSIQIEELPLRYFSTITSKASCTCKDCLLKEKVIKELENVLYEKTEENRKLKESMEEMKVKYGMEMGSELQKYKVKYFISEKEGDIKNQQIKNYENIFNYLKFYNGFSKQQTTFIEFINELHRLEKQNLNLKEKCMKYEKENNFSKKGNLSKAPGSQESLKLKKASKQELSSTKKPNLLESIELKAKDKNSKEEAEDDKEPLELLNCLVEQINTVFGKLETLFEREDFLESIKYIYSKRNEILKSAEELRQMEQIENKMHKQQSITSAEYNQILNTFDKNNQMLDSEELTTASIEEREFVKKIVKESRNLIGEGLSILLSVLDSFGKSSFTPPQSHLPDQQT